jgi:hypothetical protein
LNFGRRQQLLLAISFLLNARFINGLPVDY